MIIEHLLLYVSGDGGPEWNEIYAAKEVTGSKQDQSQRLPGWRVEKHQIYI